MNVCPREDELLAALERGFVGAELHEHVLVCESCRELHLVAGAFLHDHAHAVAEAPIPSSGTMWWRMRVRQRHDAESTARRSLLIGQAVTVAIALALLVKFFGADVAGVARQLVASIDISKPLLFVLAAWILAAPIAGWVAIRQK
jgi:predicted anti-sigma-YlaC factor YlaD